ncbi:MAG: starch-binding protein [Muribaculaceae bacterium]|nr:starch-binding protein [Muribaculaceae bacterium]
MRKKLLTKHCALLLLAIIAATWSSAAWAFTINVNVTGSQAPYVYAWDSNQTPLIGSFPGTQLTNVKKVGNKMWYYIDVDASCSNVILSFGTDATKTGDIPVNGNRYFEFANNNANNVTDYYDCPGGFEFEASPFVYLVDVRNWTSAYAYVWNGDNNNGWPGEPMKYLGTNGNGNKVYRWKNANLSFTPANIKFNNVVNGSATEEGNNLPWTNGAFWSNYNWSYAMTIEGAVLNSTYFPDENLRKAITASTGVNEGDVITPNNVTVLDISYDTSKGMTGKISNPTGIEKFTALEELYARDNSLTHLDLTNTSTLRILDVSGNDVLMGMRVTSYCSETGHGVNVKGNNNFKKLIADNCPAWEYNAGLGSGTNYQNITSLEYISQKNNPLDGWSGGFAAQTNLKYLDLTNTGQNVNHNTTGSRISVTGFTNLETLILADNTSLCSGTNSYLDLTHNTNLKYLDLSNTGLNETKAKTTLNTVALSNLETLKINKNLSLKYAYTEKLSNLKHFEIADGDLYFTTTYQLSTLTPTNNPNLEYLDISNDQIYSSANPIDGFQNLKTVIAGNNPNMPKLTIDNCPAIETVDVSNNSVQTILSITNSALTAIPDIDFTNTPLLTKLDLSNNNFTAVPEVASTIVTTMVMNSNLLRNLTVPSNIKYLYAEDNNFGTGEFEMPATSLVGLDLANNGFTKFKMTGNTTLKALTLAVDNSRNSTLTEIELHGNTKLTQTSPNGNIEISDCDEEDETTQDRFNKGLYIKGLSNLQTLNIENSSFEKLGQQNSLEGLTGLTKLQARKNKFTTFTNGVNDLDVAGSGNYRKADPTESSLEHLEALEYLDLAYNNLQDSVHLYKNVALKHLDVSHNNEIHGVIDGTIKVSDVAAQDAMRTKKAKRLVKYGMYYGDKGELTDELYAQACAVQNPRQVPFDIRYEDLNDTTGLYHLDLQKNVNLEWIDISYTNIHNTAAGPGVMNPGWMSASWVGDSDEALAAEVKPNTTSLRSHSAFHTFVYFAPCSKLKTIHMDHCNLQSLGVSYFPELDTLTASYMYGDCYFMRDATKTDLRYGMANTGPGRVKKYLSPKTNSETGIQDQVNVVGPDGTSNTYYDNNIKYYDLSYSGFNELRFNYGINLKYIDVRGNPLNFQVHPNSDVSYYNSLDVTYCPNIETVKADNCSDLPIVRAYNRPALTTLNLDGNANLKTVYIQNNPAMNHFTGLSTLAGLETLFAYSNPQFGGIDVSNNTVLKNLWISNIGASSINLSKNTALTKLRIYDNSLTALNVASNPALTWLDLARNQVPSLDLSSNESLQYFNCSNSVESLTDPSLADGSHDGSEADEKVPVSGTAKADNGGNSLSDLEFAAAAPLTDVRANYNDLHKITGGFAGLTNIEYAHNHINGINLSAANLSNLTVNSEDNGRTITADCATFRKKVNGTVQEYKVYFFQLQDVEGNGAQLTTKTSTDGKGTTRVLGTDGLALDNITAWTSDAAVLAASTTGAHLNSTITPDDMSALDPGDVPGQIVVLKPTNEDAQGGATGEAQYSYNDGFESGHTSTYYLKWSSNGTVTGISQIDPDQDFNIENTSGSLIVTGSDGTTVGVYDMNGRLVANEVITGGKATITGLTPGIYIVNGNKVLIK